MSKGEVESEVESDVESEITNNPLFLRKAELPQHTTKFQIVSKLEHLYGHFSQFSVIEYDKYFYIDFPSKALYKKAFKDGIDFGGIAVNNFYNLMNHLNWLEAN